MTATGRIGMAIALGAGVLLFIVAARPGRPRGAAAPRPAAGAQAFLDQLRTATGTPAVSGAVALGGKVVFSGGAGMIDLENHVAATGSSVYNIDSLSKAVTAIAVMQLVEERRISLDDDVRSYVPELPDKGVTITIRNLLTHTSGIRHYHPTDFPGTPDNENIQPITSWKDGLRFFAADPLLFPPGKFFFYSSYAVNSARWPGDRTYNIVVVRG